MKKYVLPLLVIALITMLSAISAYSQEAKQEGVKAPAADASQAPSVPAGAPAAPAKTNDLSIYGEVQSVNVQALSMIVQYYDYDNDEEKSLEIAVDKDSKLENAKSIGDIKKGDWVDVTYTSAGGKNTAKMVSVEKEEPAAEENAPAAVEE